MGRGAGLEGSGCGQLPGRFGEVSSLAGIDDDDRQGRRSQCRAHGPVVAARRFEHNARGRYGLEPGNTGRKPGLSVRDRPAFTWGPQGNIALRFGDLYANKNLRGRPHNS
jgi:hypothetical protein